MDRFNVLRSGGVIDRDTYEQLIRILDKLEIHRDLPISDENGSGLMVYLGLMLMRFKRNEVSAPMASELFEEFKVHKSYYSIALEVIEEIEAMIDLHIPESERQYLVANIFTILDPDGKK
ncbi:PRD domain-containing protein [Entomospira culicis]|uniref:PRD domain-containing protein n=2 Tax=Entomospira culicis TaxID=2719989 RepID=A0A968GH42_9SPIO|nr:PRD domain-containing protein [Entomospira culicis]NIZ19374.1 PRD domain-containing protein [Entomospira culicis]NIZ69721.1 PRD domain-containing protein [Entomospira culicis]WDI38461.1 PRD domain-containing protein [Entomospira culicis]